MASSGWLTGGSFLAQPEDSTDVRPLCAGKTFESTSQGDATLKGFDEQVALYEVRTS